MKYLKVALAIVIFIIAVTLVVIGQKEVSYERLAMMLVGLVALLGLIYAYNRKYE